MGGPSIDPEDVGLTGLLWLFLSYGYVLYFAANLIGEGSELLLLVPSMAGLVGGVVLPLLGAVPDGAIILFSGLGSLEQAQETLSVGVGALAGSTVMLLTVPWALSVYAGRVNLTDGKPNYKAHPKLSPNKTYEEELYTSGITITDEVRHAGVIMAVTTIPYFLIQVPALFLHGPSEEVAKGEHWWALAALIICLIGLFYYMKVQLKFSAEGLDKSKRIAVTKKKLEEGKLSLSGALQPSIISAELQATTTGETSPLTSGPPPGVQKMLKEVLKDPFHAYDKDGNGMLERKEIRVFFKDFHENIDDTELEQLLDKVDRDNDGVIDFEEFIALSYKLILSRDQKEKKLERNVSGITGDVVDGIWENGDDEEDEEIPEEFTDLSPDEQQAAIKLRAFKMLAVGTLLVIYFSDPMVDVMQEIAVRANLPPFYVSFVLAPLASNSSEVVASMYYASKKTRKTMAVSLSALEGAASMNNTFCLSIFMCLIFFRGLAWQYTAETITIVVVEFIMAWMVQSEVMNGKRAAIVLALFPLSLLLVATLEFFGLD